MRLSEAPHIDQYFGFWAIEGSRFQAAADRISRVDLRSHVQGVQVDARQRVKSDGGLPEGTVRSGVAVIDIAGPMMKQVGSLNEGTSSIMVRQLLRAAVRDESVESILLRIDSPGGTVAGTNDLATDVSAAARRKPVVAFVEDLGASAAYWIASQANRVVATETALVGSIGTYGVLYDMSRLAANEGIKVLIVKAGEFKGAGEPGTEITEAQLGEYQRIVNGLNEFFVRGVAKGRNLKIAEARELNDGRIFVANEAKALRLIDAVGSFDQAIADARQMARGDKSALSAVFTEELTLAAMASSDIQSGIQEVIELNQALQARNAEMFAQHADKHDTTETKTMPDTTTPAAATHAELKAAFPAEDADFRDHCLGAAMTIDAARAYHTDLLQARVEAREQEIEQLKSEAAKPGNPALGDAAAPAAKTDEPGDAIAEWTAKFTDELKITGGDRMRATKAMARKHPDLREAYVEQYNVLHPPTNARRSTEPTKAA